MFITEKQSKLDSARIKLLLMEYFRYKKQFFGVVSEYQHCNEIEDFVAFKKYEIAVVEIKISKSDFLADFKKPKHAPAYQRWYSHFYFCVTEDLKDFVLKYLKEKGYKNYGVLIANNGNGKPYISTAKPAKKSKKENGFLRYGLFYSENSYFLEALLRRMSSEMIIDKRKATTLKDSKIKTHS